jgi:hypothetical protein
VPQSAHLGHHWHLAGDRVICSCGKVVKMLDHPSGDANQTCAKCGQPGTYVFGSEETIELHTSTPQPSA